MPWTEIEAVEMEEGRLQEMEGGSVTVREGQ